MKIHMHCFLRGPLDAERLIGKRVPFGLVLVVTLVLQVHRLAYVGLGQGRAVRHFSLVCGLELADGIERLLRHSPVSGCRLVSSATVLLFLQDDAV